MARRLVLSFAVLATGVLCALFALAWLLVWPHFTRLEQAEAQHRAATVSHIMLAEADRVGELANTYAVWDDAYEYVNGRNPDFADENLNATALEQIDLDGAIIVSESGKILFSQGPLASQPLSPRLASQIFEAKALTLDASGAAKTALIGLGEQIYFVSARRIVHTDGSGPAKGVIAFVRKLDAPILARIAELTGLAIEVYPVKSATTGLEQARNGVRGSALVVDAFGHNSIRVDVLGESNITHLGKDVLLIFLVAVCASWLFLGGALTWNLSQLVVRPVLALREHVDRRYAGETQTFDASRDPEEIAAVAIAFDNTFSRFQHEEKLQTVATQAAQVARAEAEAANAAKSRFLANMSHELRTPLSSIKSYAELVRETAAEEGRHQDIVDVDEILRASRHLLNLVNDILDLSKIEAGKMALEMVECDLAALVREVAAMVRPIADQGGNVLSVWADPSLPNCILDQGKLRQCLMNLVSNALKFTQKGVVAISARRVEHDGADCYCLEVRDSGIGIDAEAVERLFKPFSQADESTTRKFGGTGLGLSLTREFMEMMGGNATLESVKGQGSTFRLIGPMRPATSKQNIWEAVA